ncbi:hypothetical protein ACSIGC_13295 [Tenacibaculum sp. ZS6-P6]
MKFQKRFGNRKRTNSKRGLFLVILLALALYLFFNADKILSRIL